MLHIIIFILKIIGILLLVILGLILLLVSSVLFVPITYKVRAERKDGVIQVRAVAGWMFRLLSVHYRLHTSQEPMQLLQGRILGIPVWKPLEPKKEKPKKAEKKSKEKQSKPKQMEAKQLEQKAEVKSSDKAKERLKKDLTPGTAVATIPQPEPEVSRQEQPQDKQAQTKPPRQSILKKLLYAIRRIYGKITAIGRGLFSGRETASYAGESVRDDRNADGLLESGRKCESQRIHMAGTEVPVEAQPSKKSGSDTSFWI